MKKFFKKMILFLFWFLASKEGPGSPLSQWLDTIFKREEIKFFPYRVIMIKKIQPQKTISSFPIDTNQFNQYGFLSHVKLKNVNWSFLLNRFDQEQPNFSKISKEINTYRLFSKLADLNTVIFAPEKKNWWIMNESHGQLKRLTAPYFLPTINEEGIYRWFFHTAGFNGVILDRNGSNLLVGSVEPLLQKGEQGVVYKKSFGNLKIKKDELPQASAIIECLEQEKGYGLFKIIIYGSTIFPGDKIHIVKKDDML
jgi:hypothetical protein